VTRIAILSLSTEHGLALISECSSSTDRMLNQAFGYNGVAADGTVGGWICSENDASVASLSRYCYETLAQVNCLDRPDPDRNNQPQGSTGF
jgi:hypothetical protein